MSKFANLAIAVIGAFAASSAIYVVARFLIGVQDNIASGVASVPLAVLPKVYEELEKIGAQRKEAKGEIGIQNFGNFGIPPPMAVIYAVILISAVFNLAILYAELALSVTVGKGANYGPEYTASIGLVAFPIYLIGLYLTGQWIGSRSPRYGAVALLLALLISIPLDVLVRSLFYSDVVKNYVGVEPAMSVEYLGAIAKVFATTFLIRAFPLYIGYWHGRKFVVANYLQYLLGVIPSDSREALIAIAFDEAQSRTKSRSKSVIASS